jgi:HK97 family phage major capsid protein
MMSINEVQKAIADAISNGVSKEDLKSLEVKFMEMLDQRNGDQKDVESLFSKFQSDMETKLASLQTSQAKAGFIGVQKKESFGDFLVKVRNGDAELKAFTRKNLVENTGDLGGYLVPDEFMNEVLRVQLEETVVRRNGARVIPMNSPIMKIPALNMASNASGSLFGGVTAYWNGEAQEKTESNPKFKQITLEAKKLIGYVESSDELIDDAIVSMGQLLSDVFSQTIAFEEDAAFLTGNGVNKPLGIINAGATVTVNRAATNSVQTTDLINMLARFYRRGGSPVWVINQSVLPDIYKLKDENSNYILLPGFNGNISTALPTTIYGIPVVVTEKVSAKGTAGDVMLADMRYYLIGDRQRLTIEESMHVKFKFDEKAWRFVQRVDGMPWLDSAITPRAGGQTISPFVILGDYSA